MKKLLPILFCFVALSASMVATAQSFTIADTVRFSYDPVAGGSQQFNDPVSTPSGTDNVFLKWHVSATDFPADWQGGNLGICDNNNCYTNGSQSLWNSSNHVGTVYTSLKYAGPGGDFHMLLDLSAAAVGYHYMTVTLLDNATSTTKTTTFIVGSWPVGVTAVNKVDDNVSLYPNPANEEVNLVYSANANVKTIAVYNVIGKTMQVYKPLTNNSARLNIENIPAGIYFVRLLDAQGAVVASRKFTRQ